MTNQQTAMKRAAWVTIILGFLFALTALPLLHPAAHLILQIAYWPIHDVPSGLEVPAPLLVAITGGLMTGMGGMLWALGRYVSPISQEATAHVAKITAWSWFCTDSTMSVLVGAPMNVVLNAAFLALMLVSSRARDMPSNKSLAA
ncbi:MAG: hypothetical protein AAFY31_14880 [Pseudomonadota bacterium]